MFLRRIRLELARNPDAPDGNPGCGYEIIAPLTEDGHLDEAVYAASPNVCGVRRFWIGEPDEEGGLIRTASGEWAFSYEDGDDDDEPIYRLHDHKFVEGEYVSIREHDGVVRTFRVARIH